ncbi:hypothetical protein H8959_006655 [Pygathrix nigripes]
MSIVIPAQRSSPTPTHRSGSEASDLSPRQRSPNFIPVQSRAIEGKPPLQPPEDAFDEKEILPPVCPSSQSSPSLVPQAFSLLQPVICRHNLKPTLYSGINYMDTNPFSQVSISWSPLGSRMSILPFDQFHPSMEQISLVRNAVSTHPPVFMVNSPT